MPGAGWRFSISTKCASSSTENPILSSVPFRLPAAVELGPTHQMAHNALAGAHFHRHDLEAFLVEAERAVALNPNNAQVAYLGWCIAFAGSWERGVELVERAASLNPYHAGYYHFPLFFACYRRREDEAALAHALRLDAPDFPWTHLLLAAAYAQLGRQEEATAAIVELRRLDPAYTVDRAIELPRRWNIEEKIIQRLAEGLRQAGLAEK